MKEFIICYDITCPNRLGQMYRFLCKNAIAIQYSVFLFVGSQKQVNKCIENASEIINEKEDDLRVYPLPNRGFRARIGKPTLPEGIQWCGLPTTW